MSILSRLFGRGPGPTRDVSPEEHKGFQIFPEPVSAGSEWRLAARIEKEVGGARKVHHLIRADTLATVEAAAAASLAKARQVIDEQGERLFD